jgi:hypothetical protein
LVGHLPPTPLPRQILWARARVTRRSWALSDKFFEYIVLMVAFCSPNFLCISSKSRTRPAPAAAPRRSNSLSASRYPGCKRHATLLFQLHRHRRASRGGPGTRRSRLGPYPVRGGVRGRTVPLPVVIVAGTVGVQTHPSRHLQGMEFDFRNGHTVSDHIFITLGAGIYIGLRARKAGDHTRADPKTA